MNKKTGGDAVLHVVHCIDTEGPLTEDLEDTFLRLRNIFGIDMSATESNLRALQNIEVDLNGIEHDVARLVDKSLLSYNNSWSDIQCMLDDACSAEFRMRTVDDYGSGWAYSWHCMDHAGYSENPRRKDVGFGNVFRFYRHLLQTDNTGRDELNWHFHPLSFSRNPLQCATSYTNSYDVLNQVLCRRVIDEHWFPVVNRPGFHAERPDSHLFLEQWIPYDYANQYYETDNEGQPDLSDGRFGDWRRASSSWGGYQPAHEDYQSPGRCNRWIFRCLNVGTRFRQLESMHVDQAFQEADESGSAILAFCDHDYRDIRPDVEYVRSLVEQIRSKYENVKVKFSTASDAARMHVSTITGGESQRLEFDARFNGNRLEVNVTAGRVFGFQPYLALKTRCGQYYHDNFDVQTPGERWSYVFDAQTIQLSDIDKVGIASAGLCGNSFVKVLDA